MTNKAVVFGINLEELSKCSTIGERVRLIRKNRNMTQTLLAKRMRVSNAVVCHLEKNRSGVTRARWSTGDMAKVLQVPESLILSGQTKTSRRIIQHGIDIVALNDCETIQERIKFCRKQRKLSQQFVADLMRVDTSTISLLENNNRGLNPEYIERFARALQVPKSFLETPQAMHT